MLSEMGKVGALLRWWAIVVVLLQAERATCVRRPSQLLAGSRVRGVNERRGGTRALLDASCPLDFSVLDGYPRPMDNCLGILERNNTSTCCESLLSRFGLVTSLYLKNSGNFEVPGGENAQACVEAFDSKLQSQGLLPNIVPQCFPTAAPFTQGPSLCQGILRTGDFEASVDTSALKKSCNGDLLDLAVCKGCNSDMAVAVLELNATPSNRCLPFVVIYTAGVANVKGPSDPGAAECILGVTVALSTGKSRHIVLDVSLGAGIILAVSLAVAFAFYYWWRRRRRAIHQSFLDRNSRMLRPNMGLVWFNFDDIKAVTKNFSDKHLIGEGGFGKVYKGYMDDLRMEVAVKRFKNCSPETDADFRSEVERINSVRHRNLVVLRGCCIASTPTDGHQRLLIYEYMANGSLYDYLFDGIKPVLTWQARRKIAFGMAKGIAYLHDDMQPAIIHRDIKSSNILLDASLEAHVADFGLAKTITELATATGREGCVAGTYGYVAPEYALYGRITEKGDVYSFGVVLLELISGRKALDTGSELPEMKLIVDWAWALLKDGRLEDIVDERIQASTPKDEIERFVRISILCAHPLVAFRPRMRDVLRILEGDMAIPEMPDRPLPLLTPRSNHDSPRAYVFGTRGTLELASPPGIPSCESSCRKEDLSVELLDGR